MAKILLIEDDFSFQFTLKKLLECFGYTVIVADNGNDGLTQHWKNSSIDIIICDVDMPLLDGFQFLQHLQQSGKKLPAFAFISAYLDEAIIQKMDSLGADCVIKKPVDQEILKIILFALRMKRQARLRHIRPSSRIDNPTAEPHIKQGKGNSSPGNP
ncbi:MAG: response regulator [Puniceicoccales bacterium]|jgi:CheY-like chemotaxis protein|nr:response regulator [Puniceicoccales bacterium]